jgi:hypothetical protein
MLPRLPIRERLAVGMSGCVVSGQCWGMRHVAWLEQTLDELSRVPEIGYSVGGRAAAEPTALAALAFIANGRLDEAMKLGTALGEMQQANGEVAIRAGEQTPGWPTSLAISAWCAVGDALRGVAEGHRGNSLQENIDKAVSWLLANRGQAVEQSNYFGHNTQLIGWAYAEQTHSWVEPTAFAVLALKAAGKGDVPPAREGVAVLIDRQLPDGGLNYGNTEVLGQFLRPHLEPTGIGLIALAGETDASGRVAKSIEWLGRSMGPATTPLSLAWALMGLRAQGVTLPQADDWLSSAAARVNVRDRSPHKLALLALAAKGWPV